MSDPTAAIRQAIVRIEDWERYHVKTPTMSRQKEYLLRNLAVFYDAPVGLPDKEDKRT